MKFSQKGFASLSTIIPIGAIIILVGIIGAFVINQSDAAKPAAKQPLTCNLIVGQLTSEGLPMRVEFINSNRRITSPSGITANIDIGRVSMGATLATTMIPQIPPKGNYVWQHTWPEASSMTANGTNTIVASYNYNGSMYTCTGSVTY